MAKRKITLYMDELLWAAFRSACIHRKTSGSKAISELVARELARWGEVVPEQFKGEEEGKGSDE